MRRVWTRRFAAPLLLAAAILACASGGCRDGWSLPDGPTSPETPASARVSPPARDFYPLAVGNSWTCDRAYRIEIEVVIGPPYHSVRTYEGTVEYLITGTDTISGVEYLVEQATLTVPDRPETVRTRTGLRQDHAGLYGADALLASSERAPRRTALGGGPGTSLSEPMPAIAAKAWREHARRFVEIRRSLEPGAAHPPSAAGRPGGVSNGELQFLAYPLHPGATWFNRENPFVVRSEVEAHEVTELPAGRFAAYRIRLDNRFLDDDDRVLVWYGRCGRVAYAVHTETWAMDIETGETALITIDETERLRELELAKPTGCGEPRTIRGR